jgi:hypothetical protein
VCAGEGATVAEVRAIACMCVCVCVCVRACVLAKANKGKNQDMLTAPERKRLEELNLEHKKKSESKAFNLELHRRLAEELAKQKAKFRSVPVPKFPSEVT